VGFAQLGQRPGIVLSYCLKGDLVCLGDIAIHEVGHLFGRPHCPARGCTMHDKEGRVAIGRTKTYLCRLCRKALKAALRRRSGRSHL
jgi:hypothetical protein